MEAPVPELVGEFVRAVRVSAANSDGNVLLPALVDDFQSSSAISKRDMRRMLEKDAAWLLQSSCRVLKVSAEGPGAVYLMELLWSNPVLVSGLIDPALLPLDTATGAFCGAAARTAAPCVPGGEGGVRVA
jgi:hypothetical protein